MIEWAGRIFKISTIDNYDNNRRVIAICSSLLYIVDSGHSVLHILHSSEEHYMSINSLFVERFVCFSLWAPHKTNEFKLLNNQQSSLMAYWVGKIGVWFFFFVCDFICLSQLRYLRVQFELKIVSMKLQLA